eukprot:4405013-Pleurochrysis_carterae.AAC.1
MTSVDCRPQADAESVWAPDRSQVAAKHSGELSLTFGAGDGEASTGACEADGGSSSAPKETASISGSRAASE